MNKNLDSNFKIIKEGKNISEEEKLENQKESKKKVIIQYIVPLIFLIIIAIIYIPTQINFLLVPFGILMFIVLWGWDCSSRTCKNCKKWNSIVWTKTEKLSRKTNITKRSLLKKDKKKEVKERFTRLTGKCKNCECEYQTERNKLF